MGDGVWFLPCLTARCDAPQWQQGALLVQPVRLVKRLVSILRQRRPGQAVAAGGSTARTNARLVRDAAPVDVVASRVDRLRFGQASLPAADHPVLEVVAASSIEEGILRQAIDKVGVERRHERFPYGLAVHFQDVPRPERASARDRFLRTLQTVTDLAQKDLCAAVPLDPADQSSLQPGEAEEGFVSLFNGRDLSGWVPIAEQANFVVEEGVLRTARMQGGHVRSWNAYGDFVFRGEYWIEAGGNSGFFIRAPLVGRCSRIGFEVQIRGQDLGAPVDKESNGAIYDVRPPRANFGKPNAWNEVEITCVGTEVTVKTNGKVGHHFRYEDVDFMKGRSTRGFIGLQDHHHLAKFRNLRIKRLAAHSRQPTP
ncbi:MAG: hypothetical protein BMS9Abin04_485 [Planctomycetia bacterium]|nr:MAG: hypothetical protein BMS9Abin04_485 [Planctomycetia bacterium]